tara:strand:- start:693 stop:1718 length:1026 start_codon:yes stop_codon:yes gene_type:complete
MIYNRLFILLLSVFLSQDFPELGTQESLDVMTWNVEHFPKNNNTLQYVEDIIESSNLDIIALQEIENQNDFNILANNLDNWVGYRYSNSNYGELSYLINLDNIDIVQTPYSILNQYDHYFAYRPPYVIKINFNNKEIIIINVHFKCCGDGNLENDYWDEEYRRLQANYYLKQYIETYFSNDYVIVLGDFNDDIAESNSNNVFLDFINDSNSYYFADMSIANGPSSDWSFPTWPSHLDHILISNEFFDIFSNNIISTYKIDNYMNSWQQYDNYISDHRPVVINFLWESIGDLNQDGNINILDITILINLILDTEYLDLADFNNDGGLNILDLVVLVDLILSN